MDLTSLQLAGHSTPNGTPVLRIPAQTHAPPRKDLTKERRKRQRKEGIKEEEREKEHRHSSHDGILLKTVDPIRSHLGYRHC